MTVFAAAVVFPSVLSAQSDRPKARVVVAKVAASRLPESKSFSGKLVPVRRSIVGSAVDGRVTFVFVEEGDTVSADGSAPTAKNLPQGAAVIGQPLVQLRTDHLDNEIKAAELELQMQKLALQELEIILPLEVESAVASLELAKQRLEHSKVNHERLQKLVETDASAQEKLDEAYSVLKTRQHQMVVAEALVKELNATRELE